MKNETELMKFIFYDNNQDRVAYINLSLVSLS